MLESTERVLVVRRSEVSPRVTVVVPTLNQAAFLEHALQSVVIQRTPVDLIVVDGGSSDDTAEILSRWEPCIAWWRSRPDAGQSAAINEGMAHSTAPYVAWLNSDDWYLPGGLDTLVDALDRNPKSPGVYADALNADEQGRANGKYFTQTFTRRNLAWRCFISQPATLLRRSTWEALGGVDESLNYAMDYDLWWRIFRSFGPLIRVRKTVAVNRAHWATKTQSARRAQCTEAMRIVERNVGYVPLKWYVGWPYSVWYKSLLYRVSVSRRSSNASDSLEHDRNVGARVPTALIVKLAAIGDVVMALPMVSAIRASRPGVRITWMCGASVAPLLACVDGVDECVIVNDRALLAGSTLQKLVGVLVTWLRIGGRRFDDVYVAHSDYRYRFLVAPVITSCRRSLGGDRTHRPLVQGRTHTDEYVRLITGLDDYRAPAFPAPPLRLVMSPALSTRVDRFANGRPLIAINPGGARNVARENPLRRWPLDRYARLALELDARGYAIVVTGDPDDAWVRPAFNDASLDLIGATSLTDLAALFGRCMAVVGHDTGPLHLARLVATNVVALLGPTPPSMFFRKEARTTAVWPGRILPCAPCYDGYEFAECGNNVCMQMIECQSVIDIIDGMKPVR